MKWPINIFIFTIFTGCSDVPESILERIRNSSSTTLQTFTCGTQGSTVKTDIETKYYTLLESKINRSVAWSSDGKQIYVLNAPANCLESYDFDGQSLKLNTATPVGMRPIALAVNGDKVWVVNQLSDSVSIVDTSLQQPIVVRTLLIGDEPADIIFAGTQKHKAFITTAHRGQNHPKFEPDELFSSTTGRADLWVYDSENPGEGLSGDPEIITPFTDSLRALTTNADGSLVYVASLFSGNNTSIIDERSVTNDALDKPTPHTNIGGVTQPPTGLIVKFNAQTNKWLDEDGKDWSHHIRLSLPDNDVFVIDADSSPIKIVDIIKEVGTIIFNMAVNTSTGDLYVTNLESKNHIRFSGPGNNSTSVQGIFAENRISRVSSSPATTHQINHINLNPHISSSNASAAEKADSLSQPMAIIMSSDNQYMYITMTGTGTVTKIPTSAITSGSYQPNQKTNIRLAKASPIGCALSDDGQFLACYAQADNSLNVINTSSMKRVDKVTMYTPEPPELIAGRSIFYSAVEGSDNGTVACSSCHTFAESDRLAWDLGNPDAPLKTNNNEYIFPLDKHTLDFHPMKGPFTTQTLMGMKNHGPMHWRGDQAGTKRVMVRGKLESFESAALKNFNESFINGLGRSQSLEDERMQLFVDYTLSLTPSPNPIQNLDGSLTPDQQKGKQIFSREITIPAKGNAGTCLHCHPTNFEKGLFSTRAIMASEFPDTSQDLKIPSLREIYKKLGMFGSPTKVDGTAFKGDQVKGFGLIHDGSLGTLHDHFTHSTPFVLSENQKLAIAKYLLVIDSNLAPIVGQQITLSSSSSDEALQRLALLEERALVTIPREECDLIFSGQVEQNFVSGIFQSDSSYLFYSGTQSSKEEMRQLLNQDTVILTFTCVPPNSGARLALNRKEI